MTLNGTKQHKAKKKRKDRCDYIKMKTTHRKVKRQLIAEQKIFVTYNKKLITKIIHIKRKKINYS